MIDPAKVRTYVVPAALSDFKVSAMELPRTPLLTRAKLTPFVTKRMEPLKGIFEHGFGPLSGRLYLKRWEDAASGV